jgi:hypothetical protein
MIKIIITVMPNSRGLHGNENAVMSSARASLMFTSSRNCDAGVNYGYRYKVRVQVSTSG